MDNGLSFQYNFFINLIMKISKTTLNLILKSILSVFTVVEGALFIIQINNLYFSRKNGGEQIYTPEIIGKYFEPIKAVSIIYIVFVVLLGIAALVLSIKEKGYKRNVTDTYKYQAMKFKASNIQSDDIKQIKKVRLIRLTILFTVLGLCALMACLYLFNPKNFSSTGDLIEEAINLVVHLLPWLLVSFAALCLYYFSNLSLLKKEMVLMRELLAGKTVTYKEEFWKIWAIRGVILAVAVTFILIGVFGKGTHDVLVKAINICTECIGLG